MSAADILKLIETVDPKHRAKLDEIDARFECWWQGNLEFISVDLRGYDCTPITTAKQIEESIEHPAGTEHRFESPKYTRSRDALKAIRPKGYVCMASMVVPSCFFVGYVWRGVEETRTVCPGLRTEELAELHAVIQAIEYERSHA